jgi:hypothetical protein
MFRFLLFIGGVLVILATFVGVETDFKTGPETLGSLIDLLYGGGVMFLMMGCLWPLIFHD